ncbi:hypothetical protein D3C85_1498220 [compost metagenome]
MLAVAGASGGDVVLGLGQFAAQGDGLVLGGTHASKRQVHPLQRRLSFDEGEGLGDGQFERQTHQLVEHAGRAIGWIVLDRDDAEEAARQVSGRREFDGLLTEAHPAIGQIGSQVLTRQQHRPLLAVVERG